MPSTYTTNLGIEKIATGEQSGTWGTTTNTNFDLIDTAVNGIVSITLSSAGNSGSPNDLPITDGTASNGRNKFIEFTDGGDLGATAYVQLTPNDAEKIVHIRNSLSGSRSIIVFQGTYNASNDFEIPNGADVTLKFDGGGSGATVTDVNVDLTVTGATIATADINGGTIDGTVIGGSSAAAGTFTTFTSTGIDDNATSTAITIDASENVGIGTTSPDTPLEVSVAGSGATDVLKLTTTATNSIPAILFEGDGLGTQHNIARIRAQVDDASNGGLVFETESSGTIAERMRIDSSGNVGIGTTSPSGTRLNVHAAGGDQLRLVSTDGASPTSILMETNTGFAARTRIRNDSGDITFVTSNTSERMRIDSSGFVGIGTSSPDRYLHVNASRSGDWLAEIHNTHTTNGYGLKVRAGDDANVTAMRVVDVSNNTIMEIQGGGNVGIGTGSPLYELSQHVSDSGANYHQFTNSTTGTTSSAGFVVGIGGGEEATLWNYESTAMRFATSSTERMRINSSGNVGIGTSSPSSKLEVSGKTIVGSDSSNALEVFSSGDTEIAFSYASKGNIYGKIIGDITTASPLGGDIAFQTATGGSLSERMRIDSSGNVGIGTASPPSGSGFTYLAVHGTTNSYLHLTNNTTGSTGNDGLDIVISGLDANVINREAGALKLWTSDTERMRIDSSGNLLIGTTTSPNGSADGIKFNAGSSGRVLSGGSTGTFNQVLFYNPNGSVGSIQTSGSATAYNTSSDQRLKENIVDAPAGNIDAIRVRSFDWKADGSHQTYGMVAQELVDVAPEAVSQGETEDDMWGVDYSKLVPMMIKEIQDLRARVAQLEGA